MKKKRADELLYEHGHCESTADAALLILEGKVRSKPDALVHKASEMFPADTVLLVDSGSGFVSRGALKLQQALEKFAPDLHGRIAVDIGASTGGFTDLMLQHGADKVYAVDVGRGLLHWKLRTDPRVVCLEGINARTLPAESVPGGADLLSMDVSFISAVKILPAANAVLKPGALAFILVKPQFEAPKQDVPPGGKDAGKTPTEKSGRHLYIHRDRLKDKEEKEPEDSDDGDEESLRSFLSGKEFENKIIYRC